MATITDRASEFVSKAKAGQKPSVSLSAEHAAMFLTELAREGVKFASECLDHIRDERLREIVETILFATAGGAALGASIGATVAGPAGAAVGAAVGAGVGLIAGVVAVSLVLRESDDGRLLVMAR